MSARSIGLAEALFSRLASGRRDMESDMAAVAMAEQSLEPRVARLEADVAHSRSDIAEMKLDIREFPHDGGHLDQRLAQLNIRWVAALASHRTWMLLQSAAILGVMARGFGWL